MAKLSDKRLSFVVHYMATNNVTQAAISAGYSKSTAKQQGSRLLTNVDIQAEIAKRTKKIMDPLEVTFERIVKEAARLAFVDPADFYTETGALKPIHEASEGLFAR